MGSNGRKIKGNVKSCYITGYGYWETDTPDETVISTPYYKKIKLEYKGKIFIIKFVRGQA